MYGKIKISAEITVITGLHIGASNVYSAIGAVDTPVIRNPFTKEPIIPGSSIKGKLRTLLSRSLTGGISLPQSHNEDNEIIRNLFGSSEKRPKKSRLQFTDAYLINKDEFDTKKVYITEIKFENTIDRSKCTANPRQIERVVPGAKFRFVVVYDIHEDANILMDMEYFSRALKLLHMDYLGGHGTRGYGRVKFGNFEVEAVDNCIDEGTRNKILELLKDVENYELLPLQV